MESYTEAKNEEMVSLIYRNINCTYEDTVLTHLEQAILHRIITENTDAFDIAIKSYIMAKNPINL